MPFGTPRWVRYMSALVGIILIIEAILLATSNIDVGIPPFLLVLVGIVELSFGAIP